MQIGVSLDEVQTYYGRLSDVDGPVGIVVEFEALPAAVVYAESGGLEAPVMDQVSTIKAEQTGFMKSLRDRGIQATELFRTQKVYNGIWLRVDPKDLKAIADTPGILAIHPIVPKTIDHTTSVPLIGAPGVWAGLGAYQGDGISIGIIDTGVDYIHTNFGGPGDYTGQDFTTIGEAGNLFPTAKVVGGWDFAGDDYDANDPSSVPVPDPDPMDCNGHGSHVAGTASGLGVNPDGTTFTGDYATLSGLTAQQYIDSFRIGPGVAPMAELYALRVFGCSGSTNLTTLAIEWAMDPNGDNNLSDHLDVINMSLGSGFGSAFDDSAAATNNAVLAGMIVVTSAGNSGDVYYITGSPGMAKYALSTANSVDSGAVFGAFELVSAPTLTPGLFGATEAVFGPELDTTGITGDLATTTPANGCTAITEDLTGKIALIDRGSCTFKTKVYNAEAKGAIGVLIANNVAGFPITMGDDPAIPAVNIPSMMTTLDTGNLLKGDMGGGAVTVRLTSQYRNTLALTNPALEDTLVTGSSRGPARNGTRLKPDITAPGDTIFSTATGTGNEGVSYGGTSMASPHVAGILALLRQQHPTWSVAELKALAMNTATNDLYTGQSHTGNRYTPTRIGAGRASVANAVESEVVAYYTGDPGQVSVAFGDVALVSSQTFTKGITISNKSGTPQAYNVTFDERYQANPGIVWSVLDAGGAAISNPVTVPANGTLEIKIQAAVDPTALTRARDATISTAGGRQRFAEGGGYVTLTSTGSEPTLRVPVHIAARPASNINTGLANIDLPDAATGTINLTPAGTPVDTADDVSLVTILELMGESPNEIASGGPSNNADIQYVGVGTDYPFWNFVDGALFFGVSTYKAWNTSNEVEFDVYIDIDEDGTSDYVLFNVNQGFFTGTTDDVMLSAYCSLSAGWCDAWYYMNFYSGSTNTNTFNNNVLTLAVPFTEIGLVEGSNTDFNFYVVSWSREFAGPVDVTGIMSYDVANQGFTAVDGNITGEPVWLDLPGFYPTYDVTYNKAAMAANGGSKGLLLLHHHNAENAAEAIPILLPTVTSILRASPNPTDAASVDFTVNFSEQVQGVDTSDFSLTTTGSVTDGAAVTAVSGSGNTYTVSVSTGIGTSGYGTIRLDVNASGTGITDMAGNPLNGGYTDGEVYDIGKVLTARLRSIAAQDGWIIEVGEFANAGGLTDSTSTTLMVGDHKNDRQYLSIVSFSTTLLPDNAVITSATLKIKRDNILGNNPFTTHKNLLVDIKNGAFSDNLTLRPTDFQAGASLKAAGTVNDTPLAGGWYVAEFDVDKIQYLVNRTGATQFRLRFQLDDNDDGTFDLIRFFSGNAPLADRPILILEYYVP